MQTTDVRPLQIYCGKLYAKDWKVLENAKNILKLPFEIMPAKAVPGGEGRVLAIGRKPEWVCDYAYVKDTGSPGLLVAMEWAVTEKYDERAVYAADVLSEAMGAKVVEIEDRRGPEPTWEEEREYRAHIAAK